jgi:hypothetical protein
MRGHEPVGQQLLQCVRIVAATGAKPLSGMMVLLRRLS